MNSFVWGWRLPAAVIRTFGWRGLMRRARHEVRRRTSRFKRAPTVPVLTGSSEAFEQYRAHEDLAGLSADRRLRALERGRRVLAGAFEAYGHDWRPLPQQPNGWQTDAASGLRFPSGPWWTVPHLPHGSDIKDVWEAGRFGWAYDLVRAYAITRDESFAAGFHERLAAWHDSNPPFYGVQWACGQETAIRALAVLHAADTLPVPARGGQTARKRMWSMLGWSGERIADAIGYALSQRNNHGLSEAAGLIHLGLRLRDIHPHARRWLRIGQRRLAEQIRDQFALSGWYAQHSFTYARVALEQVLLAQRALEHHGQSLPPDCLGRVRACVRMLVELTASENGIVPNHGANDGGRVAPFSSAPYRDFRPLLTLAALVLRQPLPSDLCPDEEIVRWFGRRPDVAPPRPDGAFSGPADWAAARIGGTSVFLRAGAHTHRPSHLDQLHVDVRFNGSEAVADPGTFTYNGPAPWQEGFAAAAAHNGPVLDGLEPAERGSRFFWLSWPRPARLIDVRVDEGAAAIVAEIPGQIRRRVAATQSAVTVMDDVLDRSAQTLQVSWLLAPPPRCSIVEVDGAQQIEAGADSVDGWFCPTYRLRQASCVVRARRIATPGAGPLITAIRRPEVPT